LQQSPRLLKGEALRRLLLPGPLIAAVEVEGEHLVFLNAEGTLAALFLMEIVGNWSEISVRSLAWSRS
jgi:hypothetical protein